MSNKEVTQIKSLGERVNFAPNKRDEQKIVWLVNDSNGEDGISDVMRDAIAFYYYAKKSGKAEKLRKEMMSEYE